MDDEFKSFIAKADSLLQKYENQKWYFSLKFLENWTNFLNAEVVPEERKRKGMKNDSNIVTQFSTYWERLHEIKTKNFNRFQFFQL